MNNRRKLIIALSASTLAAPFGSFAQQPPGKVWRIGELSNRPGLDSSSEALRRGLRELGYIEGKNLVIEARFAKGNTASLTGLAAELVRLKLDCIVVNGVDAIRATRQATAGIPIVMANISDDPVRLGLISSLAHPGGNITGIASIAEELAGKRLQLLKETVPKASRVGVLWDKNSGAAAGQLIGTETAAGTLGIRLQHLALQRPEDLENAFRAATKERADALTVVSVGMMASLDSRIVELAAKSRLPAIYSNFRFISQGGLMSYASNSDDQYYRAAIFVDKILKGAKPADLPVERPTKFELIINLKAAKQIGLTIPRAVLVRADKVIE